MTTRLEVKIKVVEVFLPEDVHGMLQQLAPDSYRVFINRNMPEDEKTSTFIHEVLHIWHGDFDREISVNELESLRHLEASTLSYRHST